MVGIGLPVFVDAEVVQMGKHTDERDEFMGIAVGSIEFQ
jgi:hypothetical protein